CCFTLSAGPICSNFITPSCRRVRSELSMGQPPDGLMSSLWRLRLKYVRAGSSILARQGIMMILAFHAPCWRGRRAIRIYPIGPTPLCPRAGRADRCLQRLVRLAGHEHLPRFCRTSFGQSKFSREVWGGFEYFFERIRPHIRAGAVFPCPRAPAQPAAAAPLTVKARRVACQPTPQLCL